VEGEQSKPNTKTALRVGQVAVIVQLYIQPDWAGVCFTRDPLGGRQSVLEYTSGPGSAVVGGTTKPFVYQWYRTSSIDSSILPRLDEAARVFQAIETHFAFPQDVEWCIKDGVWFYLQTRPITSLSQAQYDQALYLDRELPRDQWYLYAKTEVTEVAPRPTPLTLDLLRSIYAAGGPVERVYAKFRIHYTPQDFLVLLGQELYCDRERELHTLLPAYSYHRSKGADPVLESFRGLRQSWRNSARLRSLPLQEVGSLRQRLEVALATPPTSGDLAESFNSFRERYTLVFEINLLAGVALQRLQAALASSGLSAAEVLAQPLPHDWLPSAVDAGTWKGNSLELADESSFVSSAPSPLPRSAEPVATRSKQAEAEIVAAMHYMQLRERARWYMVQNLNVLRESVRSAAIELGFKDWHLALFATFPQLVAGAAAESQCRQAREQREGYARFSFPATLASDPGKVAPQEQRGVSAGLASGTVVTADTIAHGSSATPLVLYTKVLSPDLAGYLPKVAAVISESGGLLSHLAILAREQGIPVVVGCSLPRGGVAIGEVVTVDGAAGTVELASG
jgi:phosphohistidine swiveling domain-containing protein